ncbi:MAG: restriction endonuclease subunit S [Erysipelotrichaceae bacterium]|nr:restriction endonuclease subunit S [Erysipelotrichaceae bacterium]
MVELGTLIHPAKYVRCGDGEYPVLSMTMHDGLVFQDDKFKKVIASKDRSGYKLVYRNQLVISFPIDEGVLAAQRIVDAGIVSPAYGIWDIDQTQVLPEFLEYSLRCERALDYYKAKLRGSTARRRSLPTPTLLAFSVPLPEIKEQQQILEIIHHVKATCGLRQQELQKLDELIKARFVEMFGDPATNPFGWVETTVGDECYYIKDGPHKSLADIGKENGGHPFISVRNIVNGYIDFSTARYISDDDYADAIKKCHPEKGDMLYSKGGTTGIAKLIDIDEPFANWVHVAVLKFDKEKLNGLFFENMLNGAYCYDQSQRLTKGIANRDLVLSAMAQIKMYRPPMDLQEQFSDFVNQVDKSKFLENSNT